MTRRLVSTLAIASLLALVGCNEESATPDPIKEKPAPVIPEPVIPDPVKPGNQTSSLKAILEQGIYSLSAYIFDEKASTTSNHNIWDSVLNTSITTACEQDWDLTTGTASEETCELEEEPNSTKIGTETIWTLNDSNELVQIKYDEIKHDSELNIEGFSSQTDEYYLDGKLAYTNEITVESQVTRIEIGDDSVATVISDFFTSTTMPTYISDDIKAKINPLASFSNGSEVFDLSMNVKGILEEFSRVPLAQTSGSFMIPNRPKTIDELLESSHYILTACSFEKYETCFIKLNSSVGATKGNATLHRRDREYSDLVLLAAHETTTWKRGTKYKQDAIIFSESLGVNDYQYLVETKEGTVLFIEPIDSTSEKVQMTYMNEQALKDLKSAIDDVFKSYVPQQAICLLTYLYAGAKTAPNWY